MQTLRILAAYLPPHAPLDYLREVWASALTRDGLRLRLATSHFLSYQYDETVLLVLGLVAWNGFTTEHYESGAAALVLSLVFSRLCAGGE